MATLLAREQQRADDQASRIDELQNQLMQMHLLLHNMQQSSNQTTRPEHDQAGAQSDDESIDNNALAQQPALARQDSAPTFNEPALDEQHHLDNNHDALPPHPPSVPPFARPQPAPSQLIPAVSAAPRSQPPTPQAPAPLQPTRLAKADLTRLSTSLEPSTVHRWIDALIETFEDYSPDVANLLALPLDRALRTLGTHPHLRPLDRWAARQALNTMQVEKPYVQLLLNASTPEAAAARTSGVRLLAYVRDRTSICNGESARLRIKHFDATAYFSSGMDAATTHLRADELRNDFLALPAERTAAPNALLRAVLDKLPASVATQAALLEDKLVEAEVLSQSPPWTFDQLVQLVAHHILVAARRATMTTGGAQVHAVEARPPKKSDRGSRPEQSKCPCCGSLGHKPRECPTTCKQCKQRSCPGNYGSSCVIFANSFPDNVINASGKPVPPNIKSILLKVREKRMSGSSSASTSASTAKNVHVLEANPLPDDNSHMWEIMDDDGKAAHALIAVDAQFPTPSPSAREQLLDDRHKEACPTFKAPTGERIRVQPRMIMIDGGSNINLFSHSNVPRLGIPVPSAPVQVSGWSDSVAQSVLSTYRIDLQLEFIGGTTRRITTDVAFSDQSRRDILSESAMWDVSSWSVLKEPAMRIDTPSGSIPLVRLNGIYFIEALVLPPASKIAPQVPLAEANALSAKRHGALHLARLWAARMHAGSAVLRRQLAATSGMGIEELSSAMAKVADQDVLNKRSNARRTSATRSTSAPTKPGELFILDAFGPVAAQSVLDGSHYELEGVCANTGYGYESTAHSLTQTQWLAFIAGIVANERALGHEVKRLRFDRAPNLHADSFQQAVHIQFQIAVEFAARHEGVGAAEQRNDMKQRIAEADLMRAERTQSYLLPARVYAGWRINRRVAAGSTLTRFELHTGRRPDLSDPVPYLFGISCAVLEDEVERGPKGAGCSSDSLHKGRTSAGVFVGIAGYSYKVRLDRGVTVERRHIIPHDEHVLLLRGVPSSAVMIDASTSMYN